MPFLSDIKEDTMNSSNPSFGGFLNSSDSTAAFNSSHSANETLFNKTHQVIIKCKFTSLLT